MSRSGKIPISLAGGVAVSTADSTVTVTGPKGEVVKHLPPMVRLEQEGEELWVRRDNDDREARAFQGLAHSLLRAAVEGVKNGFTRELEIVGLGYRAELQGAKLVFQLGYCHPVEYELPHGVTAKVENQTQIALEGIDKELLGQVAAHLRQLREPDAYKGKGVRYKGEQIRLKAGKSGVGGAA